MEKKTVDVIIPAYRPGEGWKQMLRGLEGQTWPVHRLIVMNTGKEKWKAAYEKTTIPMEVRPSDQRGIRSWKDKGSGGADEPGRLSAVYDPGCIAGRLPSDRKAGGGDGTG